VQMPRAMASLRIAPAWGERKSAGGVVGGVKPVRLVFGTGQTGLGSAEWQVWFSCP
jgi:hypothetical protein